MLPSTLSWRFGCFHLDIHVLNGRSLGSAALIAAAGQRISGHLSVMTNLRCSPRSAKEAYLVVHGHGGRDERPAAVQLLNEPGHALSFTPLQVCPHLQVPAAGFCSLLKASTFADCASPHRG